MDHHRHVHVLEGTRFEQIDLAPVLLLGGGAEHGEADAQRFGEGSEGVARPQGRGGDDVVPASVTHTGQGVVFGADDDVGPGGSDPGGERGVETVGRMADVEAAAAEEARQPGR